MMMKRLLRTGLAIAAVTIATPLASHADPPCVVINGYEYCPTGPAPSAPEISSSASIGGLVLLLSGVAILRGRKQVKVTE